MSTPNPPAETSPGAASEAAPLLEMRGITKRFPGVVADDRVDFDVRRGEVHTLFGENGAGKSTLMRVLYGLYKADEGEIRLNGLPVSIASPADAIAHGIGMIHQHFMLVNTLTVAENVALGLRSSRGPLTDLGAVTARVRELSERYGLVVDPDAVIWQLSVGERQRVEIIKALYRNASLLILDEPTAVLTPQEVDDLFAVLRQMVEDGRGLVFISHKIREVLELSDRITVLRAGRKIGTVSPQGITPHELAEMMVGHALTSEEPPAAKSAGTTRLAIADLRGDGRPGHRGGARPRPRSPLGRDRRDRRRLGKRAARARGGNRRPPAPDRRVDQARRNRGRAPTAGRDPQSRPRLRPRGADARRRRPRLHAWPRTCS